jgi:hypothetical protein
VGGKVNPCDLNVNNEYPSDFEIHSVYIWNGLLTTVQMKIVTSALRAELGGTPDRPDGVAEFSVERGMARDTAYCLPSPTTCGPGYEPGSANDVCSECVAGKFSDARDANACTDCPVGSSSMSRSSGCTRPVTFKAILMMQLSSFTTNEQNIYLDGVADALNAPRSKMFIDEIQWGEEGAYIEVHTVAEVNPALADAVEANGGWDSRDTWKTICGGGNFTT